ncbi:MAG: hypothetical protein H5T78_26485 [Nocardia sp.]|nr:hypothetical protein [Nocardia sp.]
MDGDGDQQCQGAQVGELGGCREQGQQLAGSQKRKVGIAETGVEAAQPVSFRWKPIDGDAELGVADEQDLVDRLREGEEVVSTGRLGGGEGAGC